jgi:hypothetical protein
MTTVIVLVVLNNECVAAFIDIEIIEVPPVATHLNAEDVVLLNGDVEGTSHFEPVKIGNGKFFMNFLKRSRIFIIA